MGARGAAFTSTTPPLFSNQTHFPPVTGKSSTNNTQKPLHFGRVSDKEWKMPQYTVHVSTTLPNNGNTSDVWNSDTSTDDRSQLLTWLSPLNPGMRHWDIQEQRANGVGEWLLQTEEIRRWYAGSEKGEGESAVLFCYGDPGVGKTFIR